MFDALVEQCQARNLRKIVGIYISSKKNSMVAGHYLNLGFTAIEGGSDTQQLWHYDVPQSYAPKTQHIRGIASSAGANAVAALVFDPEQNFTSSGSHRS